MKVLVTPSSLYTFKYEIGFTSTDIDFVDSDNSGGNSEISVIDSINGRNHILKLYEETNAFEVGLDHTGFNINSTGAIEFLHYIESAAGTPMLYLYLYDGATVLVRFMIDVRSGFAYYYNTGGGEQKICDIENHDWNIISIRVDIDAGVNGQFDCYIYNSGGTELGNVTGVEFQNNATTVDKLTFASEGKAANDKSFYLDNFGITAEGSYTQGDILTTETDFSTYIYDTIITGGIIPRRWYFYFKCHPNYQTYFDKGDFIDIFDDTPTLRFGGIIISKNRNTDTGMYEFKCVAMSNELYERTYTTSWSSNDTDTKQKAVIDNALEFCYYDDEITTDPSTTYDYEYNRACAYIFYFARFLERQVGFIKPDGEICTYSYNDLVATGESWTLNDGNQVAFLIDIPKFSLDTIPGYFSGNTGITSVSVLYQNNTSVTRPATPSETFVKKRLNEFRDLKIQASTEANQLGDNLYNIFSADTIFLGLHIEGQGWQQPGQTIQIQTSANDQIVITQDDFLILSIKYDPQNDIYYEMILSDNIIFPSEFLSYLDTSKYQIHTAINQSAENQSYLGGSSNTYLEYDDDDPASNIIDQTDLTLDGNWNECDLDSYTTVPSDAIGFFAKVIIRDGAGGNLLCQFRSTSQANSVQVCYCRTIGSTYYSYHIPIPLDSNHKFDYSIPAGVDNVYIAVLWWIHQPSLG